jgi:hypothetical protein
VFIAVQAEAGAKPTVLRGYKNEKQPNDKQQERCSRNLRMEQQEVQVMSPVEVVHAAHNIAISRMN